MPASHDLPAAKDRASLEMECNKHADRSHDIMRLSASLPGSAKFSTIAALLWLCFGIAPALGQPAMPQAPCVGMAPLPPFPAMVPPGTAPAVARVWQAEQSQGWIPPACTGWVGGPAQESRMLVAIAGRFRFDGSADQLLSRFGMITSLPGVRYWSASEKAWRPLVSSAWTLDGPDATRRHADFSTADLARRRDFYFAQRDGRSSGDVIYRMRLLESGPDRLVVATENVTPIRLLVITLFQPGSLQTVQILQRLPDASWGYYGLTRALRAGTSSFASGHQDSYVNRASALFHFIAGVPSEQDPPLAR